MSAGASQATAYTNFPARRRRTSKVRAPETAGAGLHAFWQVHVGRRPAADGLHELCISEPENAQSPSARGRRSWAPRILASSCRPAAQGRHEPREWSWVPFGSSCRERMSSLHELPPRIQNLAGLDAGWRQDGGFWMHFGIPSGSSCRERLHSLHELPTQNPRFSPRVDVGLSPLSRRPT